MIDGLEFDAIIDGLEAAMDYQSDDEKKSTQIIINGLLAAKEYA